MKADKLSFVNFIKQYFPYFSVDRQNVDAIVLIGLWANRDPKFESEKEGRYLEKGLLRYGNVGTGKTETFYVLFYYLKYLNSPYLFKKSTVWKYAEAYQKIGIDCYKEEHKHNRLYDELCMPEKELVVNYGNRTLIGADLITRRYDTFEDSGYQSHFTTNANYETLQKEYGERIFSRLLLMCNPISIIGEDRRRTVRPAFKRNMNAPQMPLSSNLLQNEEDMHKAAQNGYYKQFCETKMLHPDAYVHYNALVYYGCEVATEKDLNVIAEMVRAARIEEITPESNNPVQERRNRTLRAQYREDRLDDEEKTILWSSTRRVAVMQFYQKKKDAGEEFIFPPLK